MHVDIYEDQAGEFRFRPVAGNSEIFGDGYQSPSHAERGYIAHLEAAIRAGYLVVDEYNGTVRVDVAAIDFQRTSTS